MHETLSEKTATPQTEQEPSQSDQKIAALTAVYDAVRRRVYENSEHSNHDINEATIITGRPHCVRSVPQCWATA